MIEVCVQISHYAKHGERRTLRKNMGRIRTAVAEALSIDFQKQHQLTADDVSLVTHTLSHEDTVHSDNITDLEFTIKIKRKYPTVSNPDKLASVIVRRILEDCPDFQNILNPSMRLHIEQYRSAGGLDHLLNLPNKEG